MHPMTSPSGLLRRHDRIVIDWSDLFSKGGPGEGDAEIEKLIGWVHTYPRRSNIHVYLQSRKQNEINYRLKNRLQSLGCTVTVRHQFAMI